LFDALPRDVQQLAIKNYHLWRSDPRHPSLHFRRLEGSADRFSVLVGDHYGALGTPGVQIRSRGFGSAHMPNTIGSWVRELTAANHQVLRAVGLAGKLLPLDDFHHEGDVAGVVGFFSSMTAALRY